jgi:small-conductance mechanosensitive channel
MDNDKEIEAAKLLLDEWKIVIQTQMHFNDMIMRMRTNVVTIVLAFLGAASISLQYDSLFMSFSGFSFHASILIIISGLVLLFGVFILDYFYYYRMLRGAVNRGYQIDEAFKNKKFNGAKLFGMSTEIRDAIGKPHWSKYCIWAFYGVVLVFGIVFIIFILCGYPPTSNV